MQVLRAAEPVDVLATAWRVPPNQPVATPPVATAPVAAVADPVTGAVQDRKVAHDRAPGAVHAPASVPPNMTAADRAAIASATGFYISATGEVTPDGMAPWGYIVQYVEQRRAQRMPTPPQIAPVSAVGMDTSGRSVDVSA